MFVWLEGLDWQNVKSLSSFSLWELAKITTEDAATGKDAVLGVNNSLGIHANVSVVEI